MMDELVRILQDGNHSLVVAGDGIRTFDGRGISDLYGILTEHPGVISTSALGLLEDSGISLRFAEKVPYIINRKRDDLCPVETLCKDCVTAAQCLPLIREFVTKIPTSKRII